MKFEIKRDELLKLKQTDYNMYQFLISQSVEEKDYCETLDKQKLATECGLGYFKIEDLFTVQQVMEASKKFKVETTIIKTVSEKEDSCKHKALVDCINKNQDKSFSIVCNDEESMEIQKILFQKTKVRWADKTKDRISATEGIHRLSVGVFSNNELTTFYKTHLYENEPIKLDFNYDVKTETFI